MTEMNEKVEDKVYYLNDETYIVNRNAGIIMILPGRETKEAADRML